jgi:hypothetical protein
MKTAIEIIDETVAFYGDDPKGRRSLGLSSVGNVTCFYHGEEGKKCAVGRCLTDSGLEKAHEFEKSPPPTGASVKEFDSKFELELNLIEVYRGHSIDFWKDLQALHDHDRMWGKFFGLTEDGHQYVEVLKQKYA